jgi:hypothetical protein
MTNKYIQCTAQKTKDRATQTPLKTEGESRCSERVSYPCFTSGTMFVSSFHQDPTYWCHSLKYGTKSYEKPILLCLFIKQV